MSRFPLVLFWLAGFIALAASVEYQCFVNQLVGSQSRQNAARDQYGKSSDQNEVVTRSSGVNKTAPKNESSDTNQNTNHEPDDRATNAEVSMAYATWVGSVFTGLAFGGLIYTFLLTQKQTEKLEEANRVMREANAAATEAHNAERRPWLSLSIRLDKKGIEPHVPGQDCFRLPVYATVTNHGSSPAFGVFYSFRIEFGHHEEQVINALKLHEEMMHYRPDWQAHEYQTVFPGETRDLPEKRRLISTIDIDNALRQHMTASAWLGVTVHYESPHSGIQQTTLISRLALRYPPHQHMRFDIVGKFDWTERELEMVLVSSSAT